MLIRETQDSDLNDILFVERTAFVDDDTIEELVRNLLQDPSAQPAVSLLAFLQDRPVGHILFTAAHLLRTEVPATIALLGPLAVVPDVQKQGIGGKLIEKGLQMLTEKGVELVFVLGHPDYYPRHGFQPAGRLGFEAPYPILEKNAGAWMVQALKEGVIDAVSGMVMCADAFKRPEYWRE